MHGESFPLKNNEETLHNGATFMKEAKEEQVLFSEFSSDLARSFYQTMAFSDEKKSHDSSKFSATILL